VWFSTHLQSGRFLSSNSLNFGSSDLKKSVQSGKNGEGQEIATCSPSHKYSASSWYSPFGSCISQGSRKVHIFRPTWFASQVGAFWGCTNPLLKRGSKGVENVKAKNPSGREYTGVLCRFQMFCFKFWKKVSELHVCVCV
jgi:hypothetical protein